MDTFNHTPKGTFRTKTKMRMCQSCYENCLNLGSSDEEFDGEAPIADNNDELSLETSEQGSVHHISTAVHNERTSIGMGMGPLGAGSNPLNVQVLNPDSFRDMQRRSGRFQDFSIQGHSDDEDGYESSDEDNALYHNPGNISNSTLNYSAIINQQNPALPPPSLGSTSIDNGGIMAKWEKHGHSRSPSRSVNGFMRGRSGTSLSADQPFNIGPRAIRLGQRKISFANRTRPTLSSAPVASQYSVSRPFIPDNLISAPQTIELNNASIAHAKAILRQVLEQRGMPGKLGKWIDALMPPLLQCASHISLDFKVSGESDFRKVVKLKRIPGGLPSHSECIDGVVFAQSLPLKSIPPTIINPSFLLASNLFEHPRLHVSRIVDVSSQEIQREDTLVRRVLQLKPSVIFTTGGASRSVLNKLAERGVVVLINVKRSVIDRISRYTKAPIVNYESLSTATQLGHCSRFEVKTFRYKDNVTKYIFLSGIAKELGCTVLLRGADKESLGSVKRIVQLMVYIMFNLKLETCLLRQEFALVPDVPPLLKKIDSIRTQNLLEGKSDFSVQSFPSASGVDVSVDSFNPSLINGKLLSTSPFVDYGLPYLLQAVQKSEDQLVAIDQTKDSQTENVRKLIKDVGLSLEQLPGGEDTIIEMANFLSEYISRKLYETWSKRSKQWQNLFLRESDIFTTEFHLHIALLHTSVCMPTATPCYGPELITLVYYHDKQDMTLGHFIESLCVESKIQCDQGCGETLKSHRSSYSNGSGRLDISIQDYNFNITTKQDTIMMWSVCKVCSASTPTVPMSADTWQYSLGKYFELSFCSSELSFVDNICPHNLYRDHTRYFGFNNLMVCMEYKKIHPYELVLPSTKIECVPSQGMKLKTESYSKILEAVEKFYDSVSIRLYSVKVDELAPENIEDSGIKVSELLARTREEKQSVIDDLNKIFVKTPPTVYLPLNSVLRSMQGYAISWDYEFAEFENNFFPSEKDITRITAAHLKKLFLSDDIHEKKQQLNEKARNQSVDPIGKAVTNEKVETGVEMTEIHKQDPTEIKKEDEAESVTKDGTELSEKKEDNKSQDTLEPNYKSNNALDPAKIQVDSETHANSDLKAEEVDFTGPDPLKNDLKNDADSEAEKKDIVDSKESKGSKLISNPSESTPDDNKPNDTKLPELVATSPPKKDIIPRTRSAVEVTCTKSMNQLKSESSVNQNIPDLSIEDPKPNFFPPSPGTQRDLGRVQEAVSRMESTNNASSTLSPKANSAGPSMVTLRDKTGSTMAPVSSVSNALTDTTEPEKASKTNTTTPITKKQPSAASSNVPFKVRPSSIPVLKGSDLDTSSSERMMEYAKFRLKYNSQGPSGAAFGKPGNEEGNKSTLSNNVKFQSKFDKIGYSPFGGFQNRFNAPLGSSWAPGSHSLLNRSDGSKNALPSGISRVSSLAKHFEQLSKEFEKERARERKMLTQTQYRAVPVATSKPIVEVFENVADAVEELSQSEDEIEESSDESSADELEVGRYNRRSGTKHLQKEGQKRKTRLPPKDKHDSLLDAQIHELEGSPTTESRNQIFERLDSSLDHSDTPEIEERNFDTDNNTTDTHSVTQFEDGVINDGMFQSGALTKDKLVDEGSSPEDQQTPCSSEEIPLPPSERLGILQSLASFWADRSATGWRPLEYPLSHSDHMFADSDVIVREDEPSSLIAFCLSYPDYKEKLKNLRQQDKAFNDSDTHDEAKEIERHMLKNTGTHLKYQFQERSAKLSCKIFYAEQFDAIRRQCDCDDLFIQSMSRCVKWDSSGGKSGSGFLKTLDDRFVLKELSPAEMDAFVKCAPSYFEFLAQAFFHDLPTAMAKILGFYQIQMRNPITHKNFKMDVIVMENLFYGHKTIKLFDLKGSMRNRHVEQTGRENEVLLDENMVEYISQSPLYLRRHSKQSLRFSLFNDTLFLAKMNVMDYSLVIGIDSEREEIIVGIIDFIRTFTWDKKLESWVKERGLVGGGLKEPTVVSPKIYKTRFREAMNHYFMLVPDCWHPLMKDGAPDEQLAIR